ncbi:adenine phosphoribosyltransferase Apt [Gottschalkia purinilytica]|uniref:Adenine phosphoribosyltransferase n=1 Tax=Gottschalkia purinilytica TaxID=1503 RepID=A0A0L0WB26_GOTPU|nr:adenine phosphoribosyltransferase [Gottschalkia purinilytica]KNF08698.1 adenine phosphoribosyltransferase Apt [Gottschalkia purinilytica]
MDLRNKIRSVQNFPKEGIDFKDITTLLKDKEAFKECIKQMANKFKNEKIDIIVGAEARGFIIGAPLAYELNAGFVPVRKLGKLPSDTIKYEYELEYGTDTLEMHKDAISKGNRVLIVDDLLATGGTSYSVAKMVETLGGEVVGFDFLIELEFLNGREVLKGYKVESIIKY